MATEDLFFFGAKSRGHRVPTGVVGGKAKTTPFSSAGIPEHYDPSDLAAAWRVVNSIRTSKEFENAMADAATLDSLFRAAMKESSTLNFQRFNQELDYTRKNAGGEHKAEIALMQGKKDSLTLKNLVALNAIISSEARLWGIDRGTLASVTAAELLVGFHPRTEKWFMSKLGVKKLIKAPPVSELYRGHKKHHKKGFKKRPSYRGKKRGRR